MSTLKLLFGHQIEGKTEDLVVEHGEAQRQSQADRVRHDEVVFRSGCTARDRANFTGLVLGCIEAKFCK